MKYKAPFGPTLQQIHDALVSGFHGYKLPSFVDQNGRLTTELSATNTNNTSPSGGRFPFLAFRTGSFSISPWKDWQWSLSWDIPATLTVQGPAEDCEVTARKALNDIIERTTQLIGLPLDEKGRVVPLNVNTIRLFDDGKLTFLCERGAPYLKSASVIAVDDGLCRCELVFHVEATMSFDRRELNRMKVGVLGLNAVPPSGLYQDTTAEDGRGVRILFGTSDETAFGMNNTQDPDFSGLNVVAPLSPATVSRNVDLRPSELVKQVNVTPYSGALSAGSPTLQLSAIALYNDYHSSYVSTTAAWSTTNASVATVSSSGLVTRVAAGSCTITCIYSGVTSNSVTITAT